MTAAKATIPAPNRCDKFPLEAAAVIEVVLIGFFTCTLIAGSYLMYLYCGLTSLVIFLLLIYLALPFLWHFSPTVQRHIVYMHKLRWTPGGKDYYLPSKHGIIGARNFYLADLEMISLSSRTDKDKGREIGVWQILPRSLLNEFMAANGKEESTPCENGLEPTTSKKITKPFNWSLSLQSGHPIVVYFHGNMDTRANKHRAEIYKLFQELDMHVITFDYTGFADSTSTKKSGPTETSTVKDGLLVLNWISSCILQVRSGINGGNNNNSNAMKVPVILWGHSLGTGVASAVMSKLQKVESYLVAGLVLEAPFTSIADVVMCHPIAKAYSFWPKYKWLFGASLKFNDMAYESDKHLSNLPSNFPIQILHSINDPVIPFYNCEKLINVLKSSPGRRSCNQSDPTMNIHINTFNQLNTLMAHAFICRCPELPEIIKNFIQQCAQKM